MEIEWLEDFLAVLEHGGFSRAAAERHITQPALSRRIQALEAWVGTSLLHRTTHSLSLTAAGESFQATAEEVLRRLSVGRVDALEQSHAATGLLKFAATNALSLGFFPDWLSRVERSLPFSITVQLAANHMETCERMMVQGHSHFLLCHHHPAAATLLTPPQFRSLPVGDDRLVPVSVPDAGKPRFALPGRPDTPLPYLAFRPESGMGRIVTADQRARPRDVWLKAGSTTHLAKLLVTMVLDGRGVAWCPLSLVQEAMEDGRLVRAGDESWDVPMQIVLVRPRSRLPPVAEKFWAHIEMKSGHVPAAD